MTEIMLEQHISIKQPTLITELKNKLKTSVCFQLIIMIISFVHALKPFVPFLLLHHVTIQHLQTRAPVDDKRTDVVASMTVKDLQYKHQQE